MEAIIAAAIALLGDAVKMIADAQMAKNEEHAAILSRLEASRAALAGAKTQAHQELEATLAATQAVIDAIKKRVAVT